jgi:DNA gyrase subunit A
MKLTDRTGKVIAIRSVTPGEELMLITRNGIINRQRTDEIRLIGRATQGVRLVALDEGDVVMDVARVIPEDDVEELVEIGDDGGADVSPAGDVLETEPEAN